MLAPFATFLTYAIVAKVNNNEKLLSAEAFAPLSLINLATNPIILFCQALPTCMRAVACFRRIETYCLKQPFGTAPCASGSSEKSSSSTELDRVSRMPVSHQDLVSLTAADVSWTEESSRVVLRGLNLAVYTGFTAIVGPVASGKSTLLATLLSETILTRGLHSVLKPRGSWITRYGGTSSDTRLLTRSGRILLSMFAAFKTT